MSQFASNNVLLAPVRTPYGPKDDLSVYYIFQMRRLSDSTALRVRTESEWYHVFHDMTILECSTYLARLKYSRVATCLIHYACRNYLGYSGNCL